jgi:hypothetical protein
MNCPICRQAVPPGDPASPFCSERCRTIDLGNWSAGEYRLPVVEQESTEELLVPEEDSENV